MAPSLPDVELIPREVLFGNPERVNPQISPAGTHVAVVAPRDNVLNLWVAELGSDRFEPITDDRNRGVMHFFWQPDSRGLLYLQDRDGDENWRLFAVDLETRTVRDLTPFEGVQVQMIKVHSSRPDEVLVGINLDNPMFHDVYRLQLSTGELTKILDNPGVYRWVADEDFVPRAGLKPLDGGDMALIVRDGDGAEWREILTLASEDAMTTQALRFTADGRGLYVITPAGANAGRLVEIDTTTGEVRRVLAEDANNDVIMAIPHPVEPRFQLALLLRERLDYIALDESIREDLDTLRAMHRGDFFIQGRDDADRTWLVAFGADDGPVEYHVWDRDTKTATFLFAHLPALRDYTLGSMEPFSFTSRDGLRISGYLTFPPGLERKNLPVVVNVHGGPWARDMWGYNPEAQWLANRGYLCVQVNYRGSVGFGKDFLNAGNKEWGGRMHDDLLDALDWVVAQGYGDRERVAIYGGSYGGYAALVGATFTPDVFRCAIDMCGPSNLITFIETIPEYWKPMIAMFSQRVGNAVTERDFLWSRSPLARVDDIKIPLLVAQGANDPRVKQAESEQIVAALAAKGIPHQYVLFDDEGHGFMKPGNRLRFYGIAEAFLAEHLGGRCEPVTDDAAPTPA